MDKKMDQKLIIDLDKVPKVDKPSMYHSHLNHIEPKSEKEVEELHRKLREAGLA